MEHKQSLLTLTKRLLKIAATLKKFFVISTIVSIIGNISQMGLMGFGAAFILSVAGKLKYANSVTYCILMIMSGILIVTCRYLEGYFSHAGSYELLAKMRVDMFGTLRKLAPGSLIGRNNGDIMAIAIADIESIEFFFAHTIGPLFTVILLPLVTLIIAGGIDMLFVYALLPIYLIISVIIPILAIKLGRNIGIGYRQKLGELKIFLLDSVYGLSEIQIFDYGKRRNEELEAVNRNINRSIHQLAYHRQLVVSTPTFFIYLARIAVIAVASYLALKGNIDTTGIIILSFLVSASFSSTQSLTTVVSSLLETYAAAQRYFDLEDMVPVVNEIVEPKELKNIDKIEFINVSFSYPEINRKIIENMNLTINFKDKIGLVGESGIGKSTLIRLLLRFYDVTSGQILINGIDIKEYSLQDLRQRIGTLEQDTFLFNDSIAANIALGKPKATKEEIVKAAQMAGIHELIISLPGQYDTMMGELQNRLSGGEKQRIGIARVLLVDPDFLVMDEPTSSLDVINEKGLLKTLAEQFENKTWLIVSHRPSSLTGCDRVIKLENKQIYELGGKA
ncbi:ABC transporter ATP-binding protein [Thomasclavelia ramosa]|uniref:ABC transporter ATP-binding protein n=1 Tax=Thomasclavelia ramosa TaxID=1547 RepID=UPI000E51C5F8|nr:ABC transporter ATP-binding protein [Thomasclavelia ramosa]RGX62653.1 ABC transporter ATP-binding protein [Thomasclavelia ramosa]